MERKTILSPCRTFRYVLWRTFDPDKPDYAMFIGLNPSTADEVEDDPTIRRCRDFAQRWGYGALCMVNLFAYRTKDPAIMKASLDPIGPDNDRWLAEFAKNAGVVVAAWGVSGNLLGRDRKVIDLLGRRLSHLGLTKDGFPRHPLYLKNSATPTIWDQTDG